MIKVCLLLMLFVLVPQTAVKHVLAPKNVGEHTGGLYQNVKNEKFDQIATVDV